MKGLDNMSEYKYSVVKIYCNQKLYKEKFPWMSPEIEKSSGSGFIIEGNKIITNAHVVSGNSFIEVRLANSAKRYVAKATYIGHDCDLAIIDVEEPSFWHHTKPLKIGGMVDTNQKINVYGFPMGGAELSITQGIVSRIDVTNYAYSNNKLLDIQVDAAINPGNSGGPAISEDKVVGVAHQGRDEGQNIGYIIPTSILKQFIYNCLDGVYRGIPCISLKFQHLENDIARKHFGMDVDQTGVRVSFIDHYSELKGVLEVGDILLKIDDYIINNDGSIDLTEDIRCDFKQAIKQKNIGDSVCIKFIRNGITHLETILLTKKMNASELVPSSNFGSQPTYYILSGVVLQPLTFSYLCEIECSLRDLYNFIEDCYMNTKKYEVIFINDILQNSDTAGYDDITNSIVVKVNNQDIRCIVDIINAAESNTLPFHIIETMNGDQIIVKNYYLKQKLISEFGEMLNLYQISQDKSNNLIDSKSRKKYTSRFPEYVPYQVAKHDKTHTPVLYQYPKVHQYGPTSSDKKIKCESAAIIPFKRKVKVKHGSN